MSGDETSRIRQVVPLGQHWPTIDPFIFCAFHHDAYPAGDGTGAPATALSGRSIGSDFSGRDGWSMYHGDRVPGFPQHPHRGFETVTVVRNGVIDHSDSLGAAARFGAGDVQWLTAGRGIVHAEMFPLLRTDAPNPTELFQIWLNLPARSKLVDPYFTMMWAEQIPHVAPVAGVEVTLIAGAWPDGPVGDAPLAPPPDSWASAPEHHVAIWHISLAPGSTCRLPAPPAGAVRTMYAYRGEVTVAGWRAETPHAVLIDDGAPVELVSASVPAELVVLQGVPIGEPVAQHGPFVMNDASEIRQAFIDYQQTSFGGWRWPDDGPIHPLDAGRFALHPGGREERF